jgi:hypothetical protein
LYLAGPTAAAAAAPWRLDWYCAEFSRAAHFTHTSSRYRRRVVLAPAEFSFQQGLTLVHFSAQLAPLLKQKHTLHTP